MKRAPGGTHDSMAHPRSRSLAGLAMHRRLRVHAALLALALLTPLTGARAEDASFGPVHEVLGMTDSPCALQLADLDADGDLDLVAVSEDTGHVVWYENVDGQGQLVEKQLLTAGLPLSHGYAVGIGDVDGDADPDVLASTRGHYSWYRNRGHASGEFGAQLPISGYVPFNCYSLFPADLDGDGDLDMAYGTTVEVGWYQNRDGLGSFGPAIALETGLFYNESVVAADLDADGDLDLLAASRVDDTISLFPNEGGGRFAARRILVSDANGVCCVVAADLDGDLDLDVLFADSVGNRVAWLRNRDGQAHFGNPQVIGLGVDGATSVVAADLDLDGDLDVLAASADDDSVSWYENQGGQGVFGERTVLLSSADRVSVVAAADLDGDTDLDVIVAATGDDQILWLENLLLP